jgi:hypothetical protein
MSTFYTTRKDPRTGRLVEHAYTTIPNPTTDANRGLSPEAAEAAARQRLAEAMPRLLNMIDRQLVTLEAKIAAAGGPTTRTSLEQERTRWQRRRGLVSEGRLPFGPRDSVDTNWTNAADKLFADASLLGLLAGDDVQPTGKPAAVQTKVSDDFTAHCHHAAAAVRALEHQRRVQAGGQDKYSAGALLERADTARYVASALDEGAVPSCKEVDTDIELFNLLVPLYPAAQREGRLIPFHHGRALEWAVTDRNSGRRK